MRDTISPQTTSLIPGNYLYTTEEGGNYYLLRALTVDLERATAVEGGASALVPYLDFDGAEKWLRVHSLHRIRLSEDERWDAVSGFMGAAFRDEPINPNE